eukprot:2856145-Prymnesium_polylepis.2
MAKDTLNICPGGVFVVVAQPGEALVEYQGQAFCCRSPLEYVEPDAPACSLSRCPSSQGASLVVSGDDARFDSGDLRQSDDTNWTPRFRLRCVGSSSIWDNETGLPLEV